MTLMARLQILAAAWQNVDNDVRTEHDPPFIYIKKIKKGVAVLNEVAFKREKQ